MRLRTLPLALIVATCAFFGVAAGPAQADSISPPGANDWTCKPSAAHPYPVVLVHGTFEDMAKNWSILSPQIKDAGYCVFALNYGNNATAHIADSAQELDTFVDSVLGATGAKKVDLVGHSQGGMMPRYYLDFLGGATKVDELVGIVPSNHGTTNPLTIPTGYAGCDACTDQMVGSPFLTHLNAKGDTVSGPDYTVITTKHDEVVTPYTSAFLSGPAKQVTNVTLQDRCPLDAFEHDQSPNDPVVAQWVLNALGRSGPADPAFVPHCG
ncbi:alpha/beta fold hydrolase [Streptomyces sp. NPDC059649]|uniref:alpha/beta fold hydrolase n=1 Tax=Streptomyces sp. NPDC059649 TaxID=3346895 RepID=UPI0036C4D799